MSLIRHSRLFLSVFMVSAASVVMMPAAARAYDADDILMSPQQSGAVDTAVNGESYDGVKVASNVTPQTPYMKDSKEHEPPAMMPEAPARKPAQADGLIPVTPSAPAANAEGKSPVDYAADTVDYDQEKRIVTLTGHVELLQDGRTLMGDRIVYNLKDDIAVAEGNVVIKDPNGDVHYAESVELSDKMRKGLVDKLFTTLADGSRIWAETGTKQEAGYTLNDASYTACKACEKEPNKRPPWQLHAQSVDWRKNEQRIVYKNAWLDLGGVPVFYTPYFSHPDGTVEQKSGFLTPTMGWNSDLGGFYSQPYYWAISPSTDTTFTLMPTTLQGPLLRNEFRKRWDTAYLETDASITNSSRTDSVGGNGVNVNDEVRGHLFANGGWDINDLWRMRTNIALSSDEQYLRQYGFSNDAVLESEVYAERFEGRNYATVKAMAFQDVRAGAAKTDQPNILPYAELSMMGDPNAMLGGRWSWDSSFLSLARDGSGQDVWRASSNVGWERQDIMPVGLVLTSNLDVRGDAYLTTNRNEAALNPLEEDTKDETRFIPSAQFTASYPLRSNFKSFQLRVEPVATLYVAPNIDNDTSIPNEDSNDVQLDVGNLFDGNRFPGLDRVEDQSHVAYGLRAGMYSYDGGELSGFLGQSYNFEDDGNPFPAGSGLESQSSDYVGSLNATFDEGRHDVSYRFQVDSDDFSSQRHELYAQTYYGPVAVDGSYLYAKGVAGTTYADSREQVRLGSTIDLSEMWTFRGDGIYDLSSDRNERGLRRAIATLTYNHECYDVGLTADRYLANESSGVQETTIMVRLGLKNLGAYETEAFSFGQGTNN